MWVSESSDKQKLSLSLHLPSSIFHLTSYIIHLHPCPLPPPALTDRPCHFVFLERKPLNGKSIQVNKDKEHFAMQENMMEDLGINIIWFEHGMFNEIPHMLKYIRTGK